MDYVANTLGIKVTAEPMAKKVNLPLFLMETYTFQAVTLGKIKCLFIKPHDELPAIPAIKKHLSIIAEQTDASLVLKLDHVNASQRKALITAKIPFVVEGNQLYLPFLGVFLQERYTSRHKKSEIFSPTAQLILFHYLYQEDGEMYTSGLAALFNLSAMQITRAVRQLVALGLITTRKDGVQIVIAGTAKGAALLDKARPYLLNPVRRRFYVEKERLPDGLPHAGLSALSEYTMLNPPGVTVYAFAGRAEELIGTDTLVDPGTQAEIEIWRYPPECLSAKEGLADLLSLWTTLEDGDARVEFAKDELLEIVWRTNNDQRTGQL